MANTKNRFVYAAASAWAGVSAADYNDSVVFIHDGANKGVKIYTQGTYFKTDFTLDDIKTMLAAGDNITFSDKSDGKITINANGLAVISVDSQDDTKLVTNAAVKTYVDNALTSALKFKGDIDASSTHTYPAEAKVGDVYVISVAGTIDDAIVEVGDTLICKVAGSVAADGWAILNKNWSVDNKNATITANAEEATTIANIGGVNITAKVTTPAVIIPDVTVTDAGSTDAFVSQLSASGHNVSATRANIADAKLVGYAKKGGIVAAADDIKSAVKKLDDAWDWTVL